MPEATQETDPDLASVPDLPGPLRTLPPGIPTLRRDRDLDRRAALTLTPDDDISLDEASALLHSDEAELSGREQL